MLIEPAGSITKYLPLFDSEKKRTVLDYGSGNLRNSIYMHRKGFRVYAVDLPHRFSMKPLPNLTCIPPEELNALDLSVDVVICTFVLNLMSPVERKSFLDTVAKKISAGGYVLVETKGFTLTDIDMMFIPKGFIRVHNHRGRYTLIVLYRYLGRVD